MGINPTPTEDACNALVVSALLLLLYVVCVINLPIATYPSTDQFGNPLPQKSKIACGLFHILLGYIGVGNFYMGKIGLGIVDVLFCWTTIPGIVNLIRGIIVLCESDEEFARKYNCIPV